jgi:branched-chain amino acid transport system substrate-binding protein
VDLPRYAEAMRKGPLASITAVLILLVALVAAACSSSGGGSSSIVKVALEGPITGPQASNGVDMLQGAKLAVQEANAGGGILGRKIELIPADDKADPAVGKQVAARMVASGVFAVVGPYNSGVGVLNLPIYVKGGVIPIHLTSNSATNGEGFTVQPKDYQVAPVEAKAIAELYRARRVAIVFDPSTYTAGIAGQVRSALEGAGVSVVAYEQVDPALHSYLDLVKRIKGMSPDLLYASTYYPQGAILAQEIQQVHMEGTCFMGLANQDPAFVQAAGLAAARACVSSGVPSAELFRGATGYVRDYRAQFGADPGTWGSFTYDSVKLLFEAVRRAGGWDTAEVRSELSRIKDYQGITGSITIDPATGNRVQVPVVLLDVNDAGRYVIDPKWAAFAGFSI